MSTSADAAREAARRPDGQFGTQERAEASAGPGGVDLMTPAQPGAQSGAEPFLVMVQPQVWVNDYAVDAQGCVTFDAGPALAAMNEDQRAYIVAEVERGGSDLDLLYEYAAERGDVEAGFGPYTVSMPYEVESDPSLLSAYLTRNPATAAGPDGGDPEDLDTPWHLARAVPARDATEMRDDLANKTRQNMQFSGGVATGDRSNDWQENYYYGYAIACSQALAALDPNTPTTDLQNAGGRIRLDTLERGLSVRTPRSDSPHPGLDADRSDAVARALFRNAIYAARTAEWAAHNNNDRSGGMANGEFNGHIYNAASFVEGTVNTSFDGHSQAAHVVREWARADYGLSVSAGAGPARREDPDDPVVFERLYRDAFAPDRHDYDEE